MRNFLRNRWTIVLGVLLVCMLSLVTSRSGQVYAEERYQELQLFAKVLNLIQQYYVEEVDTKKLIYGGIKGMLRELDPHTNFLPPDIYKEFETETSGEFGGIGIEITVQNGILTIANSGFVIQGSIYISSTAELWLVNISNSSVNGNLLIFSKKVSPGCVGLSV